MKYDWTRIDNDVNGNPRYVIHYLNLVPDLAHIDPWEMDKYAVAVKRANKIGGRKYHTKGYGGGIVFQSYELRCEEKAIDELIELEAHPLQEGY